MGQKKDFWRALCCSFVFTVLVVKWQLSDAVAEHCEREVTLSGGSQGAAVGRCASSGGCGADVAPRNGWRRRTDPLRFGGFSPGFPPRGERGVEHFGLRYVDLGGGGSAQFGGAAIPLVKLLWQRTVIGFARKLYLRRSSAVYLRFISEPATVPWGSRRSSTRDTAS